MHFDAIGRVPGDPILGLMEAYAQDTNPSKFDLGVGVYKDAQGLTPIPAVGETGRTAPGGSPDHQDLHRRSRRTGVRHGRSVNWCWAPIRS